MTSYKRHLLRPNKASKGKALPGYIYAHGGAAVMTVASDYDDSLAMVACNLNCVVVNVDFRNGPEVKCPTGQHDYRSVVLYILENASHFSMTFEVWEKS